MKGTHLGEFEEIVLLTIAALREDAYGLAIKKDLEEQAARKITLSAVHAACNRLEAKGFLSAHFGEATKMRGGKRKKIYSVSLKGQHALKAAHSLRLKLWRRIPTTSFQVDVTW